ncbi:MarR family transcriptional regulator (plasmid) [Vibrio nigripulchritudo]|uniref:MarR family winged helix-turn-helix transcriptional regulator n=1 Tax=Vibrio nigripulchritudo TaxID=28173 RepID=UPI00190ABC9A|nr:MarR family winged helix-turn-helix transcriptional regulator [Vibrio nigripulchritudo]BCL73836.1 MarR family transcriptional regulator [Vibrio nigripulchritudo]BDU35213.1 MarR family transcriptional regulator [Vibrio nigripulchritudo]
MERHEEVLVSIRQIIRAIDLHSKKLSKESGLTGPQLIIMLAVRELGDVTLRELSNFTNMSQATASTILDRLEKQDIIKRVRNPTDKRKVHACLTSRGARILVQSPTPLQQSFIDKFQQLEEWEQSLMLSSLQRLSSMMNAKNMDVAPVLELGSITKAETER